MKKALFLLLFLTCISFAQNLPMKDRFYIGYHNFMYYDVFWQWDNYRDLGVNMMQILTVVSGIFPTRSRSEQIIKFYHPNL